MKLATFKPENTSQPATLTVHQLTDKSRLLAYLQTERVYAAYAIGDLEEGMFERSSWYVAEADGETRALALVYTGFDPPVLFLMGQPGDVAALLAEATLPEDAYLTVREEHLPALGRFYQWSADSIWPMWRMVLHIPRFRPAVDAGERVRPLTLNDVERLSALYALGGGDAFAADQVAEGIFYGLEGDDGSLLATAGTHLVSLTYSVAAVGNVMTHPDQRGRGYATWVTSAVCAGLLLRGIETVVLNVAQDNAPAQHVYEKLGFVCECPFYEGIVKRLTP